MKITIREDKSCEMLDIHTSKGQTLFYGNVWDFDRSLESFADLFKKAGLEVVTKEFNYEDE